MGLKFRWGHGFMWERKAEAGLTLTDRVEAILRDDPIEAIGDASTGNISTFGPSYANMYRTQSALRTIVDFLSRNIAQCAIHLFRRGVDGVPMRQPDHAVQTLLDHPQPGVSRVRLMRAIIADKAIYDVAAVWKVRETFNPTPDPVTGLCVNRGVVKNLIRIPIPFVTIKAGSLTAPESFTILYGRDRIVVPAADMIWLAGYSPTSNIVGTPPAETLRRVLALDEAAVKDMNNYWNNGAALNLMFLQKEGTNLSDDEKERFKASWKSRYGGVKGSDARGTPMLPPGVEPFTLAPNAEDSQFLQTRELTRKEACWAYGINPQVLGISMANYASADAFHQMLYQDTLSPWMVSVQEELEEQLLREFEPADAGFSLEFNINAKLQGSMIEQAKIGQQAVGGPWMTINEFREKFQGLPPVEGGDKIIIPLNVIRGGGTQANPQDSASALAVDEEGQIFRVITGGGGE